MTELVMLFTGLACVALLAVGLGIGLVEIRKKPKPDAKIVAWGIPDESGERMRAISNSDKSGQPGWVPLVVLTK